MVRLVFKQTEASTNTTIGEGQEPVRMIDRTFCLACLHSLHAIKETLPALRRLRWLSPTLPLAPALVPPLVLDSHTNPPCLVGNEPVGWSCWWDGASDRKLDMATSISNNIYQRLILILKRMNNRLQITPGNLDKKYHFGQDRDLWIVAFINFRFSVGQISIYERK